MRDCARHGGYGRLHLHLVTPRLRWPFPAIGLTRRALTLAALAALAATLGISLAAFLMAPARVANAASRLSYYYQRGYYLDNGWLCYGWSNGVYHCTVHWHRAASGTLVSDNPAWVPNYGSSAQWAPAGQTASRPATATRSDPPPVHAAPVQQVAAAPAAVGGNPGTQAIVNEILAVFGPNGNAALNVARCESGLNPNAYNRSSGASGLFQFLASTWAGTSYAGQSPFNASANIHAAYQVFTRDGYSWREWTCKP
jgi:Transglycosylase-like domain